MIRQVPVDTPVTIPVDTATEHNPLLLDQLADSVTFCVTPLLYSPVAINGCVPPTVTVLLPLEDAIFILFKVAEDTAITKGELVIPDKLTVMLHDPAVSGVTLAAFTATVQIESVLLVQVLKNVMFCVDPSL